MVECVAYTWVLAGSFSTKSSQSVSQKRGSHRNIAAIFFEVEQLSRKAKQDLTVQGSAMINPLGTRIKELWTEAISAACYTRSPMYIRACQLEAVTTIEAITGRMPDVSNLSIFGRTAYISILRQFRGNTFSNQVREEMIVGYIRGSDHTRF